MALRKSFPAQLRELRLLCCAASESSSGLRGFINNNYVGIKKANPSVPILVREATGIEANVYARYGKYNNSVLGLV